VECEKGHPAREVRHEEKEKRDPKEPTNQLSRKEGKKTKGKNHEVYVPEKNELWQ